MIPESTSNKSVTLYKCIEFPNKWHPVRELFTNVLYADTNVFSQDDHWYLITGEMDPKNGARTKTQIYNADRIEDGILVPLECNDCVDYSFSERGAGQIFCCAGRVIRPTQCGDRFTYGKSLKLSEIIIHDGMFCETEVLSIKPEEIELDIRQKPCGVHTYGRTDDMEIIDVKFEVISNFVVLISRIERKIKRIIRKFKSKAALK